MAENPEEYRRNAEECRQQAERACRNDDKVRWLKLAEDWQNLAESIETGLYQGILTPFPDSKRYDH